jgi:DNA-binding transcriptional ArsR family regulator
MANHSVAFAALADPMRREIFERLARAPRAVGELASELPVSRPAVSQHLKVLKDAGLVVHQTHGTRNVYEIDPKGLGALRAWLDQFWAEALDAFKAEVEKDEPTHPQRHGGAQPIAPSARTPPRNPGKRHKEKQK